MKKIIIWIVLAVVIMVAIAGIFRFNFTDSSDVIPGKNLPDVRNMTYYIGTEGFALKDGFASHLRVTTSSTTNTLAIFGEPVYGDLNSDGKTNDVALWLVNNPGGSGTFYYAVLVINNSEKYQVTNTLLLGDRIAPQTLEIHDGKVVYNYAERKAGKPMTTQPSIGKSTWINYDATNNLISELIKNITEKGSGDLISVIYPKANDKIVSPLIITGEARGNWYFEASFPVTLTDWDGKIIAEGVATAKGDWMTTNFVPFMATLNFTRPDYGEKGFLIFKKDNPSGLPENDDSLEITVYFK